MMMFTCSPSDVTSGSEAAVLPFFLLPFYVTSTILQAPFVLPSFPAYYSLAILWK